MIIVSGWLKLKPGKRDAFVASSLDAMVLARRSVGCRAFVVAADPLAGDLVNVYECWDTEEDLLAFREGGPEPEMLTMIVDAQVQRHRIASSGPA
jgi:quinol monooxygenase YgiN